MTQPEEELGEHGLAQLAIDDRDDSTMGTEGGDSDSASPDVSMSTVDVDGWARHARGHTDHIPICLERQTGMRGPERRVKLHQCIKPNSALATTFPRRNVPLRSGQV